jgi:hypothetical protein
MGVLDDADFYTMGIPTAEMVGTCGWFRFPQPGKDVRSENLHVLDIASMGNWGWTTTPYARAWIGFMTEV